jgi:NAD(P)-dependent dehydrogenase (short-subunit alcohol dehydrogenase family)
VSSELDGKVALVTGASRGIGLAAAAALRDRGAQVVVTSRSEERAKEAARQLGAGVVGFGAHATDEDAARACVDFTTASYGRLDILVNNAGTNPAYGPVTDQGHGRFAKTMDVNLWAPILWTSLAVKAGMGEHGGSVVNTASIGGLSVARGTATGPCARRFRSSSTRGRRTTALRRRTGRIRARAEPALGEAPSTALVLRLCATHRGGRLVIWRSRTP